MHHFPLPDPALYLLGMSKFYPNTVHTISRMNGKFGHYYTVSSIQSIVAILHRQTGKHHGILHYFQICIQRIMPVVKVSQRVAGFITDTFIIQIGTGVTAGNQTDNNRYHHRVTQSCTESFLIFKKLCVTLYRSVVITNMFSLIPHILSSDNSYNQIPSESAYHQFLANNKVPDKVNVPSDK